MATITCPVCGRRVTTTGASEAPSRCPACGAALLAQDDSRDDSDTRPVPLEQLPATAPPAARDSGETRDLPASALPRFVTEKTEARTAARGTARRFWGGVGVVALVALLLAVVAGAALIVNNGGLPFGQQATTPTATASAPSPSAAPATTTYKRPSLYSIAYPTGWLITERNDPPDHYSASFIDLGSGASLTVTAQRTQAYVDAATVDDQYLRSLTVKTGTNPEHVSKPEAVALAGQMWTRMSADVALVTTAGTRYAHAVVMTVNYHGSIYTIVRLVPWPEKTGAGAAFAQVEQASFKPMLATFAFLG
ncbi:MAG TPA: hypothetical protein VFQ25_04785 [Ktedonobacterales bacterium]|nr:hypothetical protein [Ktedonobacterales bacterium]